jgi:hypothetical protein
MKTNIIKINEYMEYTNGVNADVFDTSRELCDFSIFTFKKHVPFEVVISKDIWNINEPFFFLTDDMIKENRSYLFCIKLPSYNYWLKNNKLEILTLTGCDVNWVDYKKEQILLTDWLNSYSVRNNDILYIKILNYIYQNKNDID